MANISWRSRGETWIQWEIYNLQYSAMLYDNFKIVLEADTASGWVFHSQHTWTSVNHSNNTWCLTPRLGIMSEYRAHGYATWKGEEYYLGYEVLKTSTPTLNYPQLEHTEIGETYIYIRTSSVLDATKYYIIVTDENKEIFSETSNSPLVVTISHLKPETSYKISVWVTGIDNEGYNASSYLKSYYITTKHTSLPPLPVPSLINIITLPNNIKINCEYLGEGTAYIFQCSDGKQMESYQPSATFIHLKPSTDYFVRYTATANYRPVNWSDWIPVKTDSLNKEPPETPVNLEQILTGTTETLCFLKWDEVTDAEGYYIYVNGNKAKDCNVSQANVTIVGSAEITISSFNDYGESAKSAPLIIWSRPTMPSYVSHILGSTSLSLTWGSSLASQYYICQYKKSNSDSWITATPQTYSTTYLFSGLSGQTSYDFRIFAARNIANGVLISDRSLTKTYLLGTGDKLSKPEIYFSYSTPYTITVEYFLIDNASTYHIDLYKNNNLIKHYDGVMPSYTFTELDPNTSYDVKCYATATGYEASAIHTITIFTKIESDKPDEWFWTQEEINAFSDDSPIMSKLFSTITYQRWNEFLDKINEFRNYHNTKYGQGVLSVSPYKLTSSDKVLTATRFNGVRFTIGSMNPTGLSDVARGDPVKGFYFTRLSNSLNSIE